MNDANVTILSRRPARMYSRSMLRTSVLIYRIGRPAGLALARLVQRGKGHGQEAAVVYIIDSDHPDFLGQAVAEPEQVVHQLGGG
jgi:hypothetical protein